MGDFHETESARGILSVEAATPQCRSRAQGQVAETQSPGAPLPGPSPRVKKFVRVNYTHHPLTQEEIERIPVLFANGCDTMRMRDVLQDARKARGNRHPVHEWQTANALSQWREKQYRVSLGDAGSGVDRQGAASQ